MKHRYLIDNKIPHGLFNPKKGDRRIPKWEEERETYGFDERETWNLGDNFLAWLYERIKMYIDVCDCDLNYHTFKYGDKEYTQKEILDKICEDIEFYYGAQYSVDPGKWEDMTVPYLKEIGALWGIVLPTMWW